jgi:ABC-type phosphate transport system substrate-binding protein
LVNSVTILALMVSLQGGAVGAKHPGFALIVHAAHPGSSVTKDELARLYLGMSQRWADGRAAVPVDQSATSAVRSEFCRSILDEDVEFIQSYWNSVAGGQRPPVVKASDAEVVAFVGATEGAVGYVTTNAQLSGQVKVLQLR